MNITNTSVAQVTSSTTLTSTVTANSGDWVLATVSMRSEGTFTGATWEMLYDSGIFQSNNVNQRMYFLQTQATSSGDITINVTGASAGRIYINLISISGINGYYLWYSGVVSSSTDAALSAPNKSVGEALIWGCSSNLWTTVSPYSNWSTSPDDLTIVSLGTDTQARQANFIDVGTGSATGRIFATPLSSPLSTGAGVLVAAVKIISISDPTVYAKINGEWKTVTSMQIIRR